jgi:hypothetical protein
LQVALSVAARALADSDPEAAATIQGAAHALSLSFLSAAPDVTVAPAAVTQTQREGVIVAARRATSETLRDTLGSERLREFRERGSTLDSDAAVAYALSHLGAFVAEAGDKNALHPSQTVP